MNFNATLLAQVIHFVILIAIFGGILTFFLKLHNYQKKSANELAEMRKILANINKRPKD